MAVPFPFMTETPIFKTSYPASFHHPRHLSCMPHSSDRRPIGPGMADCRSSWIGSATTTTTKIIRKRVFERTTRRIEIPNEQKLSTRTTNRTKPFVDSPVQNSKSLSDLQEATHRRRSKMGWRCCGAPEDRKIGAAKIYEYGGWGFRQRGIQIRCLFRD